MKMIDLAPHCTPNAVAISGREKGAALRKELDISKLDATDEEVRVIVPQRIILLNSSFFLGLFGHSVRSLGAEKFRIRYKFIANSAIFEDVEDGVRQALKESNPLET